MCDDDEKLTQIYFCSFVTTASIAITCGEMKAEAL